MIQIVDSFLRQSAPGRARLRSDARVSTGLSKPSLLDWHAHARQVAGIRPDAVVMFLGANDGFPMAGADCCGCLGGRVRAPARGMMRHLRARRSRAGLLAAAADAPAAASSARPSPR